MDINPQIKKRGIRLSTLLQDIIALAKYRGYSCEEFLGIVRRSWGDPTPKDLRDREWTRRKYGDY